MTERCCREDAGCRIASADLLSGPRRFGYRSEDAEDRAATAAHRGCDRSGLRERSFQFGDHRPSRFCHARKIVDEVTRLDTTGCDRIDRRTGYGPAPGFPWEALED